VYDSDTLAHFTSLQHKKVYVVGPCSTDVLQIKVNPENRFDNC
jgi:hypothetical protein